MISRLVMLAVFVASLFGSAFAADDSASNRERVQMRQDIWVQPEEQTGELECTGCSIHVRGHVNGDATAVGGSVTVEPGGSIAGDVAAIWGDVNVESQTNIGGDVTAIGGRMRVAPGAMIGGDRVALDRAWVLLMTLLPLVVLGGIIALIVWLFQRPRRRSLTPA